MKPSISPNSLPRRPLPSQAEPQPQGRVEEVQPSSVAQTTIDRLVLRWPYEAFVEYGKLPATRHAMSELVSECCMRQDLKHLSDVWMRCMPDSIQFSQVFFSEDVVETLSNARSMSPHWKIDEIVLLDCEICPEGIDALVSMLNGVSAWADGTAARVALRIEQWASACGWAEVANAIGALQNNSTVSELVLAGFVDVDALLGQTLCVNQSISSLTLENCDFRSPEDSHALGAATKDGRLKTLTLRGVGGLDVEGLAAKANGIRFLELTDCAVGASELAAIATLVGKNPGLEALHLNGNGIARLPDEFISAVAHHTSLRVLSLEQNELSAPEISRLMRGLAESASLESLHLSSNPLGDDGASMVGEVLQTNPCLRVLSMANADIGIDGSACVFAGLRSNTNLRHLDLSFNAISDVREGALAGNDSLEVLDVGANPLSGASLFHLLNDGSLTKLSLRGCDIAAQHVASLVNANGFARLEGLDLSDGFIALGEMEELVRAGALRRLKSLDLGGSIKDGRVIRALLAALEDPACSLRQLTLKQRWFRTDEGFVKSLVEDFRRILVTNKTLVALDHRSWSDGRESGMFDDIDWFLASNADGRIDRYFEGVFERFLSPGNDAGRHIWTMLKRDGDPAAFVRSARALSEVNRGIHDPRADPSWRGVAGLHAGSRG